MPENNWWDNLVKLLGTTAVNTAIPGGSATLSGIANIGKTVGQTNWDLNGNPNIGYTPGLQYGQMPPTGVTPSKTPTVGSTWSQWDRSIANKPTQTATNWADDPYLRALYSTLGGGANTSGYDTALQQTAAERKRIQQRYNTYSAQISDIFGNLSRKVLPEFLTGITQSSEAVRGQQAAQAAKYAQETRTAEQARLDAANAARANLGLGDTAAAAAGGDIVTQSVEAGLADKAAMDAATLQTILANEAIAKGDINRQIAGLGYGEQEALRKLGASREDVLAALAAQEAQIQAQKSQAISAGQPSTSERLAVLQAAEEYKASKMGNNVGSDPASQWLAANPAQSTAAKNLLGSFLPWFYNTAPAVEPTSGKVPTVDQYLQLFTKADPTGAAILQQNPALRDFIKAYLSTK
jgi:hypothetical protein